jgi:hypothetical protein
MSCFKMRVLPCTFTSCVKKETVRGIWVESRIQTRIGTYQETFLSLPIFLPFFSLAGSLIRRNVYPRSLPGLGPRSRPLPQPHHSAITTAQISSPGIEIPGIQKNPKSRCWQRARRILVYGWCILRSRRNSRCIQQYIQHTTSSSARFDRLIRASKSPVTWV